MPAWSIETKEVTTHEKRSHSPWEEEGDATGTTIACVVFPRGGGANIATVGLKRKRTSLGHVHLERECVRVGLGEEDAFFESDHEDGSDMSAKTGDTNRRGECGRECVEIAWRKCSLPASAKTCVSLNYEHSSSLRG